MTTTDVAKALGMSPAFVRGEIRDGRLQANATRKNKRWVYRITHEQFALYQELHWRPFHVKPIAS